MKKKMYKKNKIGILGSLLILTMIITGCGGNYASTEETAYDMAYEEIGSDFGYENDLNTEMIVAEKSFDEEIASETGDTGETNQVEEVATNRKLIKQTNLTLETLEYVSFTASLEALIEETGGYVEYSDQSNRSYYGYEEEGRYASYTVRIPVTQLDMFVNQVGDMANVRYKNESVSDVTLNYVDLESKKEMYEIEQENLMELLDRADTVEDMIIIESRLTEIRYQLQSMESQLRTYDNLVDYATITIYVNEVVRLEPSEEASVGERIRVGFSNSWNKVIDNVQEFGIRFVIALPLIVFNLLVFAIFALVIFLIIKLTIKKSRKNKKKKITEMQNNAQIQKNEVNKQETQKNK